ATRRDHPPSPPPGARHRAGGRMGRQLRRHAGGAGTLPAPPLRGPPVHDGGLPRTPPGRPPGGALALGRRRLRPSRGRPVRPAAGRHAGRHARRAHLAGPADAGALHHPVRGDAPRRTPHHPPRPRPDRRLRRPRPRRPRLRRLRPHRRLRPLRRRRRVLGLTADLGGLALVALYFGASGPIGAFALCVAAAAAGGLANVAQRRAAPPDGLRFMVWVSALSSPPLLLLSLWLEGVPDLA